MRHQRLSEHEHAHAVVVRGRRRWTVGRAFALASDHFVLLPLGAAIAMVWANTAPESYFRLSQSLAFLVNEIGMAFVLALVTQEIVEAMMRGGALHSWRRWGLPIAAAAGGIAGAASTYLLYVGLSHEPVLSQAWPIACAIDIAAAYYLVKTILPRSGVLPFVLLVGIATDAFGVLVMAPRGAVFDGHAGATVLGLVAILAAASLRAWKVPTFWPYLAVCGTASWWAFYRLGLHPALAFVPIVFFLPHEPRPLDLFAPPPDDDATHHFEHEWNHLVQIVLFFFGLVNAGVVLRGYDTGTWAFLTASLLGRPVGMLAAVGIAVAAGLHLPARVGWRELVVAALAISSGFTFALFFATGVLPIGPVLAQVTIGAVATAIGAALAVAVAAWLRVGRFKRRAAASGGRAGHPATP